MYKIIGGDGKQYGPISAEEVRKWLQDGRVNTQTLVQAENSANWNPLATFPELSVPPPSRPPVVPSRASLPGADKKIAAGLCGILLGTFGVHKFILGYTGEAVTMLAISLASIPFGFLTCGVGFVGMMAMQIIGIVEGILYLTKTDEQFVATYINSKKGWF